VTVWIVDRRVVGAESQIAAPRESYLTGFPTGRVALQDEHRGAMTEPSRHAKLVSVETADLLQADTLRRWGLSARENLGTALFGPARPRPLPQGWRAGFMVAETLAGAALLVPAAMELIFGSWTANAEAGTLFLAAFLGLVLLAVRFPMWAWRGSLVVAILTRLQFESPKAGTLQFVVLIAVFGLASGAVPRTTARWMAALTVLVGAAAFPLGYDKALWVGSTVAVVAVVMIDAMRDWQQTREALEVETAHAEREQAQRAVLEERARIGRELHDIVAHHMSLIAVQAETAPYRLGELTEPVQAEFTAINGAARAGLSEMRRLLSVLRNDEQAPREPQPDLGRVDELVEAARTSGLKVQFSGIETSAQIAPSVGLCAYRILQEALTNAGRHAAGSDVAVRISNGDGALRLEVTNGPARAGTPAAGESGPGPGHGLTGMRERANLLGGSLTAVPLAGGGFSVSAVLPVEAVR
jgi:signal transduction histidine kinase